MIPPKAVTASQYCGGRRPEARALSAYEAAETSDDLSHSYQLLGRGMHGPGLVAKYILRMLFVFEFWILHRTLLMFCCSPYTFRSSTTARVVGPAE